MICFLHMLFQVANNPCTNLLSAHFRLDGHAHVNPLHKVIQGSTQTYLFFTPSQVSYFDEFISEEMEEVDGWGRRKRKLSTHFYILNNNCFYFSDFYFQGDLHSYVRVRKRLREPEAKRLFRQMCEVVKSCHEQGIVLRDLKLRKFVFADAEK